MSCTFFIQNYTQASTEAERESAARILAALPENQPGRGVSFEIEIDPVIRAETLKREAEQRRLNGPGTGIATEIALH